MPYLALNHNEQVYDLHGVWPPPEPERPEFTSRDRPSRHSSHHQSHYRSPPRSATFPDPFFQRSDFAFTDPFVLFNSMFDEQLPRQRHQSQYNYGQSRSAPWTDDPFSRAPMLHSGISNLVANIFSEVNREFGAHSGFHHSFPSSPALVISPNEMGGGRWASQSSMTQIINGVTHSITKRRDWDVSSVFSASSVLMY